MKINEAKTDFCIFNRKVNVVTYKLINNIKIKTTQTMNSPGINFDSNLNWKEHVDKSVKMKNLFYIPKNHQKILLHRRSENFANITLFFNT
jgi:hypothetical protein